MTCDNCGKKTENTADITNIRLCDECEVLFGSAPLSGSVCTLKDCDKPATHKRICQTINGEETDAIAVCDECGDYYGVTPNRGNSGKLSTHDND